MVSGQWFQRKDLLRIGLKLHKITHNLMTNSGITLIFTKLIGVHPRNINRIFEANPCISLREEVKIVM